MTDQHAPQPAPHDGVSVPAKHTPTTIAAYDQDQISPDTPAARLGHAIRTHPGVSRSTIAFFQRTLGNRKVAHQLSRATSPHIQRVTHLNLDQIHNAVHTNPLIKQFRSKPVPVTMLIHDRAAYIKAYLEHAASQGLAKTEAEADNTEAFRGPSSLHLRADVGAEITDIHEYIHFLSDSDVRRWSEALREGVTEYLAQFVCTNATPPIPIATQAYTSEMQILTALANRAPDAMRLAMAKAYFDGSYMVLTNIVNTHTGKRANEWFAQLAALKVNEANSLLQP